MVRKLEKGWKGEGEGMERVMEGSHPTFLNVPTPLF